MQLTLDRAIIQLALLIAALILFMLLHGRSFLAHQGGLFLSPLGRCELSKLLADYLRTIKLSV
jgi:hypothetical protein